MSGRNGIRFHGSSMAPPIGARRMQARLQTPAGSAATWAFTCSALSIPAGRAAQFRAATASKPINLNFFAHRMPVRSNAREDAWREKLRPYYVELAIDPAAPVPVTNRQPFNSAMCAVVEELKPDVVSFHYGLPGGELVQRVHRSGAKVICSATTVAEARFLEANGCDALKPAVIAACF